MENANKNVVHDGEDGAAEIVAEIEDGLGKHICGGSHPAQNRRGKGHAQNGEDHTCGKAEGDIRVDGKAHMRIVLGSEIPGDHHACAHGNTVEETDHHMDDTSGGADRRQGIVPQEIANYPGVEGVV